MVNKNEFSKSVLIRENLWILKQRISDVNTVNCV
jgi:hypothetical protein